MEGETRELEVWGKGETGKGVSTKSISESWVRCEKCDELELVLVWNEEER